jgi:4-hydroxy-2-oxoheptanedioate aldolase
MRTNRLREVLEAGDVAISAWLSSESRYLAEVISYCGYDAVTVDLQHGMFGVDTALGLLQAVSAGPAVPLARCPSHDAATIGKLLDGGAYGIICPAVDTAEQAEAFVRACRYPATGSRSYGPSRGLLYGGADYLDHADATVLAWAMIESAAALTNLDDILAVAGVDGVYVGPNDLALSLGERLNQADGAPRTGEALGHIAAKARAAGVFARVFCPDATVANDVVERGYRLVTPGSDVGILREAALGRVDAIRRAGQASRGA